MWRHYRQKSLNYIFKSTNLLKIDFTFDKYNYLEYNKNENMSILSFKSLCGIFQICMVQSYLPILHYDATLFRSVNRLILKANMIS